MYKTLTACLLLVAILGAIGQAQASVTLNMFGSSSTWWVAVKPAGDDGKTSKIEMKDSTSGAAYSALTFNDGWGYWTLSSPGRAFVPPLTFRLTSSSGATITTTVASIVPGQTSDTGATYGTSTATPAPTTAPTTKPTSAPSAAPTTRPTTAPTSAPTSAPTTKPTSAPTTAPSSTNLCTIPAVSAEPLRIMVPLYVYPGAAWDALIAAASSVKILAIINPNSGPASSVDSSYSTYMTKLKNAGIEMVGYVYTSYGTRATSAVQADIDTYASKYPLLTGIFLDEGATDASKIPFYTTIYNYILAKSGYVHVIINPGTVPDQGYLAVSTNIMIYENYGTSLASTTFPSWLKCASTAAQKSGYKYRFSGIAHTASSSVEASYVQALASSGIGYVYVTDGAGGCCTYNSLTTYFAQLAASVKAINGG